jgi:3-hydroxybutyrate dehydrogenase
LTEPTAAEVTSRVAVITGGASGIGRAIALRLARAGCNVAVISLTRERVTLRPSEMKYFPPGEELLQVQAAVEALGQRCLAMDGDITVPADLEQLVQRTLEAFGRLDILVNCAATSCVHPVLEHPRETWQRVIDVNLVGAFNCVQAVLPHLLRNGWGRVINIGSTAASAGFPGYSAYCAAKHGLLGFTRALAAELASTTVTANMVSPATVETPSSPIFARYFAEQEGKSYEAKWQEMLQAYPQQRLITPEEVAELVYYLTRDEARAINGEDLRITMGSHW